MNDLSLDYLIHQIRREVNDDDSSFISTLNKMGYMTSILDPFSNEFVTFSQNAPLSVLDVGAAYGLATLHALKEGARVIANDLHPNHLDVLVNVCPPEWQTRLTTLPGAFPDEVKLPDCSLSAVLMCRVLHFFTGDEIRKAFSRVYNLLAPGGKLFVVSETPYLKNWSSYISIYESKVLQADLWPGLIEDTSLYDSTRSTQVPKKIHWLDENVLSRELRRSGFNIEKISYFPRPYFPEDVKLDGRESVGAIAIK